MSESSASHALPALEIHALAGEEELPFLTEAARLLGDCLQAATGSAWRMGLSIDEAVRADFLSPTAPALSQELRDRQLVPADVQDYRGSLYGSGPKVVVISLRADVHELAVAQLL